MQLRRYLPRRRRATAVALCAVLPIEYLSSSITSCFQVAMVMLLHAVGMLVARYKFQFLSAPLNIERSRFTIGRKRETRRRELLIVSMM